MVRRVPACFVFTLLCLCFAGGAAAKGRPEASAPPDPAVVARAAAVIAVVERRLAEEPSATLVQSWAARAAGVTPDAAARLERDAMAAGSLPWVRLRGRYEDASRVDKDELALVEGARRDSRWTAEVSLEWDLAEAVAGVSRFKAVKEGRDQMSLRQALAQQVTVVYHDRQRLLLEDALDPATFGLGDAATLARAVERRVRVRELNASLDALTGGRWGLALRRVPQAPDDLGSEPETDALARAALGATVVGAPQDGLQGPAGALHDGSKDDVGTWIVDDVRTVDLDDVEAP